MTHPVLIRPTSWERSRGFTLIEVTVGLVIAMAALSVAMGLFLQVAYASKRARTKAELARDALFVQELIGNDLRSAGLGVPRGRKVGGSAADSFSAPVLIAGIDEIAILADVPRPDASFNVFGFLEGRPTSSRTLLAWHTENNGACARNTDSAHDCDTSNTSLFFAERGCDTRPGDRVCAWGMKRVVAGEHLIVAAGDGTWQNVRVASPMAMSAEMFDPATGTGGVRGLRLDSALALTWPMNSYSAPPFNVLGQPWVASVDRVFWRFDAVNRALVRRTCWGAANPAHTSWAASSANAPDAVPGTRCTAEEVIGRNVSSATFGYFDESGAPTTDRARVRRVDWAMRFEKPLQTRLVQHDVAGSIDLRGFE